MSNRASSLYLEISWEYRELVCVKEEHHSPHRWECKVEKILGAVSNVGDV